MDGAVEGHLESIIAYFRAEPLVAAAAGLVLIFLLLRQTKTLVYLIILGVVVAGASYLILELSGMGGQSKVRMINQTGTQDVK